MNKWEKKHTLVFSSYFKVAIIILKDKLTVLYHLSANLFVSSLTPEQTSLQTLISRQTQSIIHTTNVMTHIH